MTEQEAREIMELVRTDAYRPEAIALLTAILSSGDKRGRVIVPSLEALDGFGRADLLALIVILAEYGGASLLTVAKMGAVDPWKILHGWAMMPGAGS